MGNCRYLRRCLDSHVPPYRVRYNRHHSRSHGPGNQEQKQGIERSTRPQWRRLSPQLNFTHFHVALSKQYSILTGLVLNRRPTHSTGQEMTALGASLDFVIGCISSNRPVQIAQLGGFQGSISPYSHRTSPKERTWLRVQKAPGPESQKERIHANVEKCNASLHEVCQCSY